MTNNDPGKREGASEERPEKLMKLRDQLNGCIGCACLSLAACLLVANPDLRYGR